MASCLAAPAVTHTIRGMEGETHTDILPLVYFPDEAEARAAVADFATAVLASDPSVVSVEAHVVTDKAEIDAYFARLLDGLFDNL